MRPDVDHYIASHISTVTTAVNYTAHSYFFDYRLTLSLPVNESTTPLMAGMSDFTRPSSLAYLFNSR